MAQYIAQKDSMEFNHRVIVEQKAGNNAFLTMGFAWNNDEDKDGELKKHVEAIMQAGNVHMFFIKYNS